MSSDLFINLLRPAVIQILRAQGFHGAKPSVVDTLTDITARYIVLLTTRTLEFSQHNHDDALPSVTDVRLAMQDCGLLVPTLTPSEEIWKEMLRKPLEDYEESTGARANEAERRDAEDTADVREFVNWFESKANKELGRIASLRVGKPAPQPVGTTEALDQMEMEDYLTTLMKKHSKTGVESRFKGTVLGHDLDPRSIKIEGGPVDSINEWCRRTREKSAKLAETAQEKGDMDTELDDDEDALGSPDAFGSPDEMIVE
ncbi:bromodomain associated domain-containing protein [Amniculicola lignicola CBS 123094]|uniref:Bromodomain associated domain-containing protein n=1 Tax=Amniculicola lignicola CBS 123094 TaxID=1392246 RepID=A0A6A5WDM5_9PLEO|nr:bromodomain associated domain-containing protein [Amniculicola lignicola CBS 123094]